MNIQAGIELPAAEGHCNRMPFEGCLTVLDRPSDKAPNGARGHRVVLTTEAARDALDGLIGMAVAYKSGWDGHNCRQKCGVILAASIVGVELRVSGILYHRDFPEFAGTEKREDLGMSYELADAFVDDMREQVWTLSRATFTGAAILQREKACYRATWFEYGANGPAPRPRGLCRELYAA